MHFAVKSFPELTVDELYDLLTLRQRVFSVEQACAFLDCDGLDRVALHVLGREAASAPLVSYARLFAPSKMYDEIGIGRIVVAPELRGGGHGKELVERSIALAHAAFGLGPIRIGAQQRLERFYRGFGFVTVSPPYDEDGIQHVEMLRS